MKLGVVFPQIEFPSDPILIRDYAQTAEGLGYDYFLVYDHVLGANPDRPGGWQGPYTYTDPFQEPFVLFGYLAGLTQTIEFVTGILILPQRQTALVAKQAAQVDVLSGGRLRLGVGIGWNAVEYEALNAEFGNRGRRSEEQVQLLQRLWTEELVTFDGQYHKISDAGLNPMPVQRPIPLWFGGYVDPVFRRMARYGSGWFPASTPLEKAKPMIATIRRYLEEEGRDPATFGIDPWISVANTGPDLWAARAQAWQAAGATHIAVNTMRAGFTTVAEHLDVLRRFREVVGR
jgi:probable F420-dependent oxidoreductase